MTMQSRYPSTPPTQADMLYQAGAEKHRLGNLPAATQYYVQALQADGDYAPALHMLSTMEFQKGHKESALQGLEHVIAMDYKTAMVWWHYGCVLLAVGRARDAVNAFSNALQEKPDDPELRFNLGSAARQAGDLDLAVWALRMAAPQLKTAAAYFELGLANHQAGRHLDALNAYHAALAIDGGHVQSALNAGALALTGGDCAVAIDMFKKVLACDPSHVIGAMNLGIALQDQGELDAALRTFENLLTRPLNAADKLEALNNLAAAQLRKGDNHGAEQSARAALALDPYHEAALANLTAACDDLGQKGAGIAHLQSIATKNTQDSKAWFLLGKAHEREKQQVEAIAAHQHAITHDASCAGAHDSLGKLLSQQGEHENAFVHCKKAVALAPWETPYQLNMGLVAMRCNDAKAALAAFDDILLGNRFDQQALCYRALSLRMLGRSAEADSYTDPQNVATILDIPTPAGYADMQSFLNILAQDLRDVRGRIYAPYGQSVRGGTQTQNSLFSEKVPSIQALRSVLDDVLNAEIDAWPKDDTHPFYAYRPKRLLYRSWSVILKEGGFHTPHIHPEGCLSGVLYIVVPELIGDEGSLELGKPGLTLPLPEMPPTRRIKPAPARLVLFPSYLWHGTLPFAATGERITVAFDIVQALN